MSTAARSRAPDFVPGTRPGDPVALSGELIYAVGDLHGRRDLLDKARRAISRHAAERRYSIVFLGDYIDRGPASFEVVEALSGSPRQHVICLRGNHEQALLDVARSQDLRDWRMWLKMGGVQTLASYGFCASSLDGLGAITPAHLSWFNTLPLYYYTPNHFFVHAGIAPGVAIADQKDEDYLWIRNRFLKASPADFLERRHIIHGHTPMWSGKPDAAVPELLSHRTNLDTGAFATGVLTVGVFAIDVAGGPIDLISLF